MKENDEIEAITGSYQPPQRTPLNSLPASVMQNLDRQEGPTSVLANLATGNPELCALLSAKLMGFNEVSIEQVDETSIGRWVPKTFLGIPIGEKWQTNETTRTTTKTLRLR